MNTYLQISSWAIEVEWQFCSASDWNEDNGRSGYQQLDTQKQDCCDLQIWKDSTLLVEDLCSRYTLKYVVYYGKLYLFAA
jgi:hypothetical protein